MPCLSSAGQAQRVSVGGTSALPLMLYAGPQAFAGRVPPMTRGWRAVRSVIAIATLFSLVSCHRARRYESVCQIVHKEVLEKDANGTPVLVDLELEWDPCPGEQYQMIRGGADFAKCTENMAQGDYVPVLVLHSWNELGYYTWDIEKVGPCSRPIIYPQGSYEKSQECADVLNQGFKVGFTCSRKPKHDLIRRCPWMERD